jgi:hypothetical protein
MSWLSKIWRSRRGRVVVILLLMYLVWQTWLTIAAPRKVAPGLDRMVSKRGTVDLLITLPFPPERFHILAFQRYGRVSGTSGNTAEVRGVKLKAVSELARYYWVRKVEAIQDSQVPASQGRASRDGTIVRGVGTGGNGLTQEGG